MIKHFNVGFHIIEQVNVIIVTH